MTQQLFFSNIKLRNWIFGAFFLIIPSIFFGQDPFNLIHQLILIFIFLTHFLFSINLMCYFFS